MVDGLRPPLPDRAALVALTMTAVALATWAAMPHERLMALLGEDAVVESLTQALYLCLPVLVWARHRHCGGDLRLPVALSVVFLAFGAREMDLHKPWPGAHVMRVSWYLGDAPLHRKLLALAVLAVVAVAVAHLVRRHAASTWRRFRRREPGAVAVAWFLGVMVVAKVLDRTVNVLEQDLQVAVSAAFHGLVSSLEEWLELGLPLIAGGELLRRPPPGRVLG